jgi:hypothetical protein
MAIAFDPPSAIAIVATGIVATGTGARLEMMFSRSGWSSAVRLVVSVWLIVGGSKPGRVRRCMVAEQVELGQRVRSASDR